MIILGVDPGSTSCGFAIVSTEGAKVRFREAGTFAATCHGFIAMVDAIERDDAINVVAVEQPAGFIHDPFRGPHLLATASAAGGVAWMSGFWGIDVTLIPATEVRRALLGKTRLGGKAKAGDTDKMIAMVLPGVVLDMPKKSNVHVRDALALCVAANWLTLKARKTA